MIDLSLSRHRMHELHCTATLQPYILLLWRRNIYSVGGPISHAAVRKIGSRFHGKPAHLVYHLQGLHAERVPAKKRNEE